MGQPHHAKDGRAQKKVRKTDGKKRSLNRPVPKKDPKLADYYLNRKTSPHPEKTTPVQTALPLAPRTRIAFVGNLLLVPRGATAISSPSCISVSPSTN
jgi:hypothetical protein